jgi:hypothetical protein
MSTHKNESDTRGNNVPPPPYTPAPPQYTHADELNHGIAARHASESPCTAESQNSSPHTHVPSAVSSSSTVKSKWQHLKQQNATRKSKPRNITHEEAARKSGHDDLGFRTGGGKEGGMTREEWDRERALSRKWGVEDTSSCVMM